MPTPPPRLNPAGPTHARPAHAQPAHARPTPTRLTHARLASGLRQALHTVLAEAPRFDPPPNLDLAVVLLPPGAPPVWANVLWSREMPGGWAATIDPHAGPVRGLRYLADARRGPEGTSVAWVAGTDWRRLPAAWFPPLAGSGPRRFIAPYPASLLKLMVAVGVGHLVDTGRADWDEPWPHGPAQGDLAPTIAQWAQPMIETSSNEATSALVALLHARGLIQREGWRPGEPDSGVETANGLHALFAAQGLGTLRLAQTKPDGGWFNRDGAGVGALQMTAWDTVRLLWRLSEGEPSAGDNSAAGTAAGTGTGVTRGSGSAEPAADADAIAPPAPWLPAGTPPLLSAASRARLWQWLGGQALHEVLSSTLHAGRPGWTPGIPARLPERWIQADGSVLAAGTRYPTDVREAQAAADCVFAHKTGTTASYVADAGRVLALAPGGRRYLIALQATLGSRHAPQPGLATDWCLPRLGAAIDRFIAAHWPA